jgi:hypothetical protein
MSRITMTTDISISIDTSSEPITAITRRSRGK